MLIIDEFYSDRFGFNRDPYRGLREGALEKCWAGLLSYAHHLAWDKREMPERPEERTSLDEEKRKEFDALPDLVATAVRRALEVITDCEEAAFNLALARELLERMPVRISQHLPRIARVKIEPNGHYRNALLLPRALTE
jgi:hypothetical protein